MRKSRKSCVFCQLPLVAKSREHVLPQWLLDHLGIRDTEITPTHFSAGDKVVSTRSHKLQNLVEGSVCAGCNNGWMSRLEHDAKRILVPLMSGEREVVELNKEERLLLARWTSKTAYVLNNSSNFLSNVPANHFQYIQANADSLPQDVAVVAQQHHGTMKFYWFQHQFVLGSDTHPYVETVDQAKALIQPTYKVSFLFGKLLLLIAYWPWPGWRMVLWPGIHVPLWPTKGPVGWYSKDPMPDGFPWFDSLEALTVFHQTLGVVREDRAVMPPVKI